VFRKIHPTWNTRVLMVAVLAARLPIESGICCVLLMSNLTVEAWLRFLVWLVLGLIIYVVYSRSRARMAYPARFDALVGEERD